MKSKTGFTKSECLVCLGCVVFILANIAAIGSGGRRRAKEAVCRANLHKLGAAAQMYTNDYSGLFWAGWDPAWGTKPPSMVDSWVEALYPYHRNYDLQLCPEATTLNPPYGSKFFAWGDPTWEYYPYVGSYGENGWCWDVPPILDPDGDGKIWGEDIASFWGTIAVRGNNNIPLFLDCSWFHSIPFDTDAPPAYDDESILENSDMGRYCLNRHSGGVNGVFFDGSVRKIGLKELWKLQWRPQGYYNTCNAWTVCGGVGPSDWPLWMQDFTEAVP